MAANQRTLKTGRRWWIYVLCDPRDGAVRYVGRTTDSPARLRMHIQEARSRDARRQRTVKGAWIRELLEAGLRPRMDVVLAGYGDGSAAAEKRCIKRCQKAGADLLNVRVPEFSLITVPPRVTPVLWIEAKPVRPVPRVKAARIVVKKPAKAKVADGAITMFDLVKSFDKMYIRCGGVLDLPDPVAIAYDVRCFDAMMWWFKSRDSGSVHPDQLSSRRPTAADLADTFRAMMHKRWA